MKKIFGFFLLFILSLDLYSKRILYRSEILISEKKLLNPTDPETLKEDFPKPILSQLEIFRKTESILAKAGNNKIYYIDTNNTRYTNNQSSIELEYEGDPLKFYKIEYSLNGSSYLDYPGVISLNRNGRNTIKYRSLDKLGNAEDYKSVDVYVDSNPPELSVKLVGEKFYKNDIVFYQSGMTIDTSAIDSESGLKDIYININYEGFIPINSITERFIETKFYNIQVIALDNVLNKSKEYTFQFSIDSESPFIDIKPLNTIYHDKENICSARSKFHLSASDKDSGVKSIQYKINNSEKWTSFTEDIKIPEKIETLNLEYKAIDNVGNESEVQSYSCKIIREAPKTKIELK